MITWHHLAAPLLLLATGMLLGGCRDADQPARTLVRASPSGDRLVTVTEGPHEPYSLGTYALRLYNPLDPAWPYDDSFVAGLIRPRDGGVVDLILPDGAAADQPEILVVVKSAGSGGYLSVDGFRATASRLIPAGHVFGLPPDADPAAALRDARNPCPDVDSAEVARWPHPSEPIVVVFCRWDPQPGWSESLWILDGERVTQLGTYGPGVDSFVWLDCPGLRVRPPGHQHAHGHDQRPGIGLPCRRHRPQHRRLHPKSG